MEAEFEETDEPLGEAELEEPLDEPEERLEETDEEPEETDEREVPRVDEPPAVPDDVVVACEP